jgi:formylmethanofuran dehydrogenase subunit E
MASSVGIVSVGIYLIVLFIRCRKSALSSDSCSCCCCCFNLIIISVGRRDLCIIRSPLGTRWHSQGRVVTKQQSEKSNVLKSDIQNQEKKKAKRLLKSHRQLVLERILEDSEEFSWTTQEIAFIHRKKELTSRCSSCALWLH